MRKTFLSLEKVEVGMKLAADVYDPYLRILLCSEGTQLNPSIIRGLVSRGVPHIYIMDKHQSASGKHERVFDNAYQAVKSVQEEVESIFTRLYAGKTPNLEPLLQSVLEMGRVLDENDTFPFTKALNKIREKDDHTLVHSVEVGVGTMLVGRHIGLEEEHNVKLGFGALLHDVGKVLIPKSILNKSGPLTQEEFELMKIHPESGVALLKNFGVNDEAILNSVNEHHEKVNGNGYPGSREKYQLSFEGRITAICDTFFALIADRPYRKAWNPFQAFEYIHSQIGNQFDEEVGYRFIEALSPSFLCGLEATLSDGRSGTVTKVDPRLPMRPVVKVENQEIDLKNQVDLTIKSCYLKY